MGALVVSKICLNLIVKNEAAIIERCLDSVKWLVSTFYIMDTGSSDKTIDVIKAWAERNNIQGIVTEGEFQNFAHARNLALNGALKSNLDFTHLFFLDAGMVLSNPSPEGAANLQLPGGFHYTMEQKSGNVSYFNTRIVCRDIPMEWKGVVHEYLHCDQPPLKLTGSTIKCNQDGGNQVGQMERYRDLLVQGIQDEPENSRYMFYLAQSYFDLHDWKNALHWYRQRIKVGGWVEETWYSHFRLAQCGENLKWPVKDVIEAYIKAYYMRPTRAEPLNALHWYLAHNLGRSGFDSIKGVFPLPSDTLFVEKGLYRDA